MMHIRLAAKVVDVTDDFDKEGPTVVLEINTVPLPDQVASILEEFFPSTQLIIQRALETEALVKSIRKLTK